MTSLIPVSAQVRATPFPHTIVRDALPREQVRRLIESFPPLDVVTEGKPASNNQRFSYAAHKLLADPGVADVWKSLVAEQLSQGFLDRFLGLFGDEIRTRYPELARRFGRDLAMRAGVRRRGGFRRADVLLEAQICVNTPVTARTSVRGPHVDMPDKLFAGLFYLRHPEDDAAGGDLELHRYRSTAKCLQGQFIDDADVEVVDRVRYESNVLVLFLNGIDAIHGVTPREPTSFPRMFLNLFGELPEPLFDIEAHQKQPSLAYKTRHRLQMRQKRLIRTAHGLLR